MSADFDFSFGSTSKTLNKIFNFLGRVTRPFLNHEAPSSLEVSAEGVSVRVGLLVSANEQGHPHINATQCSFQMGNFDVNITGGDYRYDML